VSSARTALRSIALPGLWRKYPFTSEAVCCQKTSLSFVDSIWEIFGPAQGVPARIIPDEVVKDPTRFVQSLEDNKVTRLASAIAAARDSETSQNLARRLACLQYCVQRRNASA